MDIYERREVVEALATAVDAKDGEVFGHSHRVADLAVLLGQEVGLAGERLHQLYVAAHLHDIGKIGIPDAILHKAGPLSGGEWRRIQAHPEIGERIVRSMSAFAATATVIRHHHEKFNGSGYPDGLAGGAILLEARIIAIADAFDAMTTDRPYRKCLAAGEALQEVLQCAGGHFDPTLATIFVEIMRREPVQRKEVG